MRAPLTIQSALPKAPRIRGSSSPRESSSSPSTVLNRNKIRIRANSHQLPCRVSWPPAEVRNFAEVVTGRSGQTERDELKHGEAEDERHSPQPQPAAAPPGRV